MSADRPSPLHPHDTATCVTSTHNYKVLGVKERGGQTRGCFVQRPDLTPAAQCFRRAVQERRPTVAVASARYYDLCREHAQLQGPQSEGSAAGKREAVLSSAQTSLSTAAQCFRPNWTKSSHFFPYRRTTGPPPLPRVGGPPKLRGQGIPKILSPRKPQKSGYNRQ